MPMIEDEPVSAADTPAYCVRVSVEEYERQKVEYTMKALEELHRQVEASRYFKKQQDELKRLQEETEQPTKKKIKKKKKRSIFKKVIKKFKRRDEELPEENQEELLKLRQDVASLKQQLSMLKGQKDQEQSNKENASPLLNRAPFSPSKLDSPSRMQSLVSPMEKLSKKPLTPRSHEDSCRKRISFSESDANSPCDVPPPPPPPPPPPAPKMNLKKKVTKQVPTTIVTKPRPISIQDELKARAAKGHHLRSVNERKVAPAKKAPSFQDELRLRLARRQQQQHQAPPPTVPSSPSPLTTPTLEPSMDADDQSEALCTPPSKNELLSSMLPPPPPPPPASFSASSSSSSSSSTLSIPPPPPPPLSMLSPISQTPQKSSLPSFHEIVASRKRSSHPKRASRGMSVPCRRLPPKSSNARCRTLEAITSLRDPSLRNSFLKKTGIARSPGGTPIRKSVTPTRGILYDALRNKFKDLHDDDFSDSESDLSDDDF